MHAWKRWASSFVVTIGFCGFYWALHSVPLARAQTTSGSVVYKVDPFWPKVLPNKWSMQQVVDIYIDKGDHIWILNRQFEATGDEIGATGGRIECCVLGPEVIEFDQDGSVMRAWGGPNYVPGWPGHLQTIGVDRDENVWISGMTPGDSIVKFTQDGKFLADFGHRGPKIPTNQVKQNNQDTEILPGGIAAFDFDEDAREIYMPDGFINKRVLVYDMDTFKFKRGWGGKGIPLSQVDNDPTPPYDTSGLPPDQTQFAPALHCAHPSRDGFVYVCERGSDRIQVFTKQGKYVKEFWIHPTTIARGEGCGGGGVKNPPCGSIYNLTLSTDPQQKYIFVADGTNDMVWILDRNNGNVVGSFGGNGRYAGQLRWIDSVAMDSKGNVYTGEVNNGKRIQKFVSVSR